MGVEKPPIIVYNRDRQKKRKKRGIFIWTM
nr:MAG TPA: hypothetical protein [Caudoviricetes sp.]